MYISSIETTTEVITTIQETTTQKITTTIQEVTTAVQETVAEALSTTTISDAIGTIAEAIDSVSTMDIIGFVVEIIGVIATVAAVIVALIANKKANDSIKTSIKMQEQSKNVDLFEKRVAVIDEIKIKTKTSKIHLNLLFDDLIVCEYEKMLLFFNDFAKAHHDLRVYSDAIEVMDGEGGYTSPIDEMIDAERILEELNYQEDKVKDFKKLCEKYQITYSESGDEKDLKLYNYKDLSNRISSTEHRFETQKKTLLDFMQRFVEDSISPIDKKVGKPK